MARDLFQEAAPTRDLFQMINSSSVDLSTIDSQLAAMYSGLKDAPPKDKVAAKYQELIQQGAPPNVAREQSLFGFESAGDALSQLYIPYLQFGYDF